MNDQEIAQTILAQLGGRRFIAMTGVKDLVALTGGGLSLRLPRKTNGITHIRIVLDPSDTYNVEFLSWSSRRLEMTIEVRRTMVHCDQLAPLFEDQTGLLTTL